MQKRFNHFKIFKKSNNDLFWKKKNFTEISWKKCHFDATVVQQLEFMIRASSWGRPGSSCLGMACSSSWLGNLGWAACNVVRLSWQQCELFLQLFVVVTFRYPKTCGWEGITSSIILNHISYSRSDLNIS